MKPNEKVLVFPAELMTKQGEFTGVNKSNPSKYLTGILGQGKHFYMERELAEKDPSFKQFIPYCVLRSGGKVFIYQRTKKGGESRLHDLYSLGVGGHINPEDGTDSEFYEVAMNRELQEEVGELPKHKNVIVGLLYDPSNEVGKVHFGIVHRLTFDTPPEIKSDDPALTNGKFADITWILANKDKFENWSQLVIEELL